MPVKLRCDERFTHAFTACSCVFKEITLVGSNQGNFFENENASSKRTLKTTVATQLNWVNLLALQQYLMHKSKLYLTPNFTWPNPILPTVNFINILRTNFSYEYDVSAAFPNYMYVEKAAETTLVWKTCAYNVDEIGT